MAIQLQPTEKNIYTIVQAIIQLVTGRHNAGGTVTLRANQTTTVVTHPNCSRDSYVALGAAQTANAAAALATSYVSAVTQGSFTVTHISNAQADKTFFYTVTGG